MFKESTKYGSVKATESQSNENTTDADHRGETLKSVNRLISNIEHFSTYIQDDKTNNYQTSAKQEVKM